MNGKAIRKASFKGIQCICFRFLEGHAFLFVGLIYADLEKI